MEVINAEFKGNWRPQAVAKHPELQSLYTATLERLRKEKDQIAGKKPKTVDATTAVLQDRIDHLQRENEDLKNKLAEIEGRLNRWRRNAAMNRIRISLLDEPLQENNRGRSDR
jgi:chromosome segregation ATPase